MKKIYLLLILFITTTVISQTPIITMVMSGDCTGKSPKLIEIYAHGKVDFTEYALENQMNANTTWGNTFELENLGTVTDEFVYVYKTDPSFATEFPSVPTANTISTNSSIINVNGDDGFRIIKNSSTPLVIDEFGENGVRGTGEPWEYVEGYAKRKNNTGPDATFNMNNWTGHNKALNGLCGTTTFEKISGAGSFTIPSVPTISTSVSEITGFTHFVGAPSVADSFIIEGIYLTEDISITASTNFEISLDLNGNYQTDITVPNTGGTVSSTKVYVRLNGLSYNLSQTGDITLESFGASDKVITLKGETLEYTVSSIADVTKIDAEGVGTSLGKFVTLTGVLHCNNFNDVGYDLTMIDDNNDGINVFSNDDISGYTAAEGDEVTVKGEIAQHNGLLQVNPSAITVVSQGAALQTPTMVIELNELTENQYIELDSLSLVNNETKWPDNGTIEVTNGTTVFEVKVPSASSMANTTIPKGIFSITGIGRQSDDSSPYTSGYQIFPCSATPLCDIDVSVTVDEAVITANASGLEYQWVDCEDYSPIVGETGQSFTATENGSYAVIIKDGPCVDTSECVIIDFLDLKNNEFSEVSVFPNPIGSELNIKSDNGILESVEIISTTGKIVYSSRVTSSDFIINTARLNAGVYFVKVRTAKSAKIYKVIK